jgi:hypothetical protein
MPEGPLTRIRVTRRHCVSLAAVAVAAALLVSCSQGGSGASPSRTSPAVSRTVPTSSASVPVRSDTGSQPASTSSSAPGTGGAVRPTSATSTATSASGSTTSAPAATTSTRTTTSTTTATSTTTRTETTTGTTTRTTTAVVAPPAATTTAAAPTPTPTSTQTSAETASTGEIPWWAWLLLLLAVVGLVAGIVALMTRRRRALGGWDQPLADAEASAQWLQDRVLPATLGVEDPAEAVAAWAAVRPRFLELDEQLTGLLRTAPDDERRAMAASLRVALADVATALDDRSSAGSMDGWVTARLRVDLARDRLERRLAHQPLVGPAAGPSPVHP